MNITKLKYWDNYIKLQEKEAEKQKIGIDEIRKNAQLLAKKFTEKGYLQYTPSEILKENDLLFAYFYDEIGRSKIKNGSIPSPVESYSDSSWMIKSDFCFINIRAASPDHNKTGKISDAIKLIPVIRANSIHLAPFFDCTMDNLYAIDSLKIITEDIIDKKMLEAGIQPDEQLMLLIDAIHILEKTVGFDLEPHTSQFSRVVLENPQHFRWLHLNKDKTALFDNLTHEEMFSQVHQQRIVSEVKAIIEKILEADNLKSVEDLSKGVETIRKAHREILNTLIKKGYWTLPSHTWNGVGLPEFESYNKNDNYPFFTYLDIEKEDQREQSFGMLTPYYIYKNLPFNSVPDRDDPPEYKTETIDFLTGIFPKIQDKYRFDFVRIDYVDHVFDSTVDETWDIPISDRMSPKVLQEVIEKARLNKPYIGAMAERMGPDIWDYQKVGFDLVLGQDVLTTMHKDYLIYCLNTQEKIESYAREWETPASILFAVDTHDSGHPLFWTMPLSQVEKVPGMCLRHFLSRFLYTGKLRRPKYEVMGNQDLSYGLYEANNKTKSLVWLNDKEYNKRYHILEDFYEEFRDFITKYQLGPLHFTNEFGFWFIDGDNERLLCFTGLEIEVKKLKYLLEKKPVYNPFKNFEIDIFEQYSFSNPQIIEYDLKTGKKKEVTVNQNGRLVINEIEPLGTRLFLIREIK